MAEEYEGALSKYTFFRVNNDAEFHKALEQGLEVLEVRLIRRTGNKQNNHQDHMLPR